MRDSREAGGFHQRDPNLLSHTSSQIATIKAQQPQQHQYHRLRRQEPGSQTILESLSLFPLLSPTLAPDFQLNSFHTYHQHSASYLTAYHCHLQGYLGTLMQIQTRALLSNPAHTTPFLGGRWCLTSIFPLDQSLLFACRFYRLDHWQVSRQPLGNAQQAAEGKGVHIWSLQLGCLSLLQYRFSSHSEK